VLIKVRSRADSEREREILSLNELPVLFSVVVKVEI
jgi:hypothetical protein